MLQKKSLNVVFVFADQWRAQAAGYAGDPNLTGKTPNIDKLASQSINFTNAISGNPVCCPYRASLLTGQYPQTHGVFTNDVRLQPNEVTLGEAFLAAGYNTGYIGKWHLDGPCRSSFIPEERRYGFEFWEVLNCTHDYNNSKYYGNDDCEHHWDGYDAFDQTNHACEYIANVDKSKPFLMMLSWGPPHEPYGTAPQEFRDMFEVDSIKLPPNVPPEHQQRAKAELAGYYAHIAAMDKCVGQLHQAIKDAGVADETIFILTSDHGDMLHSHGVVKKQSPWDESIRVPFLLYHPSQLGKTTQQIINAPDIFPTLCGLTGVEIPAGVEGRNFAPHILGSQATDDCGDLLSCFIPFGQWCRRLGGREYRGIRTQRYTYVRALDGPWLLYDNVKDPYQMDNFCGRKEYSVLQADLESKLQALLESHNDKLLPGSEHMQAWNYYEEYEVNDDETIAYSK